MNKYNLELEFTKIKEAFKRVNADMILLKEQISSLKKENNYLKSFCFLLITL